MKKYLLLLLICMSISFSVLARRMGTESGGGGGVLWLKGRPVLMDYFTIIEGVEGLPGPHYEEESGTDIRKSKAFIEARRLLDTWSKFHMDLMPEMIKAAMNGKLEWILVDEELSAPPFYIAPSIPENVKVSVAAFYEKKADNRTLVKLNKEIWGQLDFEGRVGLIIHEALREFQIGYRQGFDDEALQRSTMLYLTCTPNRRLNYYMFYILSNSPENADAIYGDFKTLFHKECRKLK